MAETKEQEVQNDVESSETPAGAEKAQTGEGLNEEGRSVSKAAFTELAPGADEGTRKNLDLLMDVSVPLTVELGCSTMKIEEVLKLSPGAVVELDKHADEPIDVKVNGKLIARGEIVVVDDFFGIRISEIVPLTEEGE